MEIKEIWKDIPNYEGYYQVSNLGRVNSLKNNKTKKDKLLKMRIGKDGYFSVLLSKERVQKRYTVHQLVAMAFLNHKPNGFEKVVNHKNFDKLDNRLENLEIVSNRENCNHKHIKSSSSYTGVHWNSRKNKWTSTIYINNKKIFLGLFTDEIKASELYEKALNNISLFKGCNNEFRQLLKNK